FLMRYHDELQKEAKQHPDWKQDMIETAEICKALAERPAETFHEAVQSMWILFVVLHMESNASSFSPGRLDEILYPYYRKDRELGRLDAQRALDI
ncbi:pyruvate formate lyase family protein, partial [Faecalibacterium sp. DFI.5.82]